jgi:hypothetical protein
MSISRCGGPVFRLPYRNRAHVIFTLKSYLIHPQQRAGRLNFFSHLNTSGQSYANSGIIKHERSGA